MKAWLHARLLDEESGKTYLRDDALLNKEVSRTANNMAEKVFIRLESEPSRIFRYYPTVTARTRDGTATHNLPNTTIHGIRYQTNSTALFSSVI